MTITFAESQYRIARTEGDSIAAVEWANIIDDLKNGGMDCD